MYIVRMPIFTLHIYTSFIYIVRIPIFILHQYIFTPKRIVYVKCISAPKMREETLNKNVNWDARDDIPVYNMLTIPTVA